MNDSSVEPHESRKTTIVVVDDNPDQWYIIQSVLADQFPETIAIWLSNIEQVITFLDETKAKRHDLPKLFLIDLYLPQRSVGWTILEMLKTDPLFRAVPAIIFSSSSDDEDIGESYMFRANSYIVKPVTHGEWQECFQMLRQYWLDTVNLPKITT